MGHVPTPPADGKVLLRTPAERDASDALYMRSRMTTASVHQSRTNWQLYLAEYEMLHGSRDEAQRLASDASRSAHTAHAAPTRWHTEGPRCVLIAEKPGPACGAAPQAGPG